MTAGERLDALLDRLGATRAAMMWGDAREGYVRLGGLVISTERWFDAQQHNAFTLGRDHQAGVDRRIVAPLTTALERRKGA